MTTTTTADTHADTAQTIAANTMAGLDLMGKGVAHGLPAPLGFDAAQDRVALQFWSHLDLARWASYVGIDVAYDRAAANLYAHAEGRWQDHPIRLASSQHIGLLSDTTCPSCEGSGEVGTGLREHDTGAWRTTTCGLCAGSGELSVEVAS